MTLREYANQHDYSVLFVVGVGCPTGEDHPLGYPDWDYPERRGLLYLDGQVDDDGCWQWDGRCHPTDDRGNTIYRLEARPNKSLWTAVIEEYESSEC